MEFKRIAALVPMRHHSQRVPGKNYRLLAGKPLYHHVLISLLNCPEIDQIAVDTDSPEIIKGLEEYFKSIQIIERPAALCADDVPMNEILMHDCSQISADLYLQTHSTNPLVQPETFSKAIRCLEDRYPEYDSLFGVTRLQVRLWDRAGRPINHNPLELLQTQDLPPTFEENSCVYLFTKENLFERKHRVGSRPFLFEIDRSEAYDIDDEEGFLIADLILQHRVNKEKGNA